MRRTLLVGAALALAGLATVLEPGVAGGVTLSYGAVLAVAAVAFLLGAGRLRQHMRTGRTTASLPPVESTPDHPAPGDEFDAELAAISPRRDRENDAARAQVRERLAAAALAVLAREGHPAERGRDLLDSGAWTDDPVAAAFFAAEPDETDEPFARRLRGSLAGDSSFDTRAKRAAHAIADRAEVDDG